MSYLIHTIEVNGQTLTRKTDGYTRYSYAIPTAGRKVEVIRAELQRVIDAPAVQAKRWIAAGLEVPELVSEKKAAKKAVRELALIVDVPAGTFIWEKASWHSDFELAMKAARGNRALVKAAIVAEV